MLTLPPSRLAKLMVVGNDESNGLPNNRFSMDIDRVGVQCLVVDEVWNIGGKKCEGGNVWAGEDRTKFEEGRKIM